MGDPGSVASSAKARIALVDDHALYREGLRAVLGPDRSVEIVGEAGGAREATALAARVDFDVAIVDVTLPDRPGAALVRDLRRIQPRCKVLALSMVEAPHAVAELLRAGAAGYALKSQPTQEIVEAIRLVLRGGRYLAPRLQREQIDGLLRRDVADPIGLLSPREREVFDLLIRGWSNERVATALSIALRTAETHRQNIMAKLGVHSIAELLRWAARHGLLE